MYPFMFRQFNVQNIAEESCRMDLPGTFRVADIYNQAADLHGKFFPENFKFVSSWDLVSRCLRLYINDCFCLQHLNFTFTLYDLFMRW